jgi:hypothetical protein
MARMRAVALELAGYSRVASLPVGVTPSWKWNNRPSPSGSVPTGGIVLTVGAAMLLDSTHA